MVKSTGSEKRKQSMKLPLKKTKMTKQKSVQYVEVSFKFSLDTLLDRLRGCHDDIPNNAKLRFWRLGSGPTFDPTFDQKADPDGVEVYWSEDEEIVK
jgi:hypothetical protein